MNDYVLIFIYICVCVMNVGYHLFPDFCKDPRASLIVRRHDAAAPFAPLLSLLNCTPGPQEEEGKAKVAVAAITSSWLMGT